ncbi:MAG: hypothetical protein HKN81_08405 [Gammaproteobacteria bacterium]|nr:hypothetical protein [Gammaproteobacteria bacterium]
MTYREFADISKSAFVEVASDEYGIKGRPTNVSRVSLLTGISRKEVRRQRELLEQQEAVPAGKTTDATRVLSGWHQDIDFLDDKGMPLEIPFDGDGVTFTQLCARYAGDIAATTLLKELKRVEAVEEQSNGRLTAVRRYYMPTQFDTQWIMNAGSIYEDLGDNINHNLVADDENPSRFLGRATDNSIDAASIPEFREFIEEHGQPFLELVDDWLTRHRASDDDSGNKNSRRVRLGLGMFLIQGDSAEEGDDQ